jgi:NAD(P)-dependent dehydrogenase (short-subunit alcohol dehydrogenase family)
VYLACRNVEKGHAAVASIVSQLGHEAATRVFCWKVDVGDLHSVRVFCEKWGEEGRRIDMLVYAMCLDDMFVRHILTACNNI